MHNTSKKDPLKTVSTKCVKWLKGCEDECVTLLWNLSDGGKKIIRKNEICKLFLI